MATLGAVDRSIQYPLTGPNFTVTLDPKFEEFCRLNPEGRLLYEMSDYEKVRAKKCNVEASIKKCDVNPIHPSGPILDHTLELVIEYLERYLKCGPGFNEDSKFNLATAAGFVYLRKGYSTKAAAIATKMFLDLYKRRNHVPLANIADKVEFLPNEDLMRDKVRTIFVDPLDKLAKCKFLFDNQNKRLIKYHEELWIKYGLTKQYGGFHKFVTQLEKFPLRDQSDISGYDRTIFLWYVYYIRWRLLDLPAEYEDDFWYMAYQTIFPAAITPDGTVFVRQTGNNSGGNNTASDNSIAHLIVIFYFLIKSYYEHFQRYISLSEILNNALYGIYSDDQTGACNFHYFGWTGIEDYTADKLRAYLDWGLVIKPSATLVTIANAGSRLDPRHEFLGSYFHYDPKVARYLPYPRLGKICSSVTRVGMNPELEEDEFFERVLALTFLAYPCPEVFNVLVKYLEFLYDTAIYKSALRHILKVNDLDFMRSSFLSMHLGWEGQQSPQPSLFEGGFIFSLLYGGGGFKSDMASRQAQVQRLSQALVTKVGMDSESVEMAKAFLSPMDFDGNLDGWPDAKTGKSITTVVTQEIQISTADPGGANWDMNIVMNPWTSNPQTTAGLSVMNGVDLYGNAVIQPLVSRHAMTQHPSVSVFRGTSGNPLGPFRLATPGNVQPIGVSLPDKYTAGVGRLIATAMEYYDTTAPVFRQGSLRCYKQPSNSFEAKSVIGYQTSSGAAITGTGTSSSIMLRRAPETPGEANLLPGTMSWKAEDGFYMVNTPIEADIPAKTVDDTQPVIFANDFSAGGRDLTAPADVITGGVAQVPLSTANPRPITATSVWNMQPWNTIGCIFTGLSFQHTGLLRVRYIYERFPSPDESDISLAAKPCAEYSPDFFRFITEALRHMPVATEVRNNTGWGWLWSALSAAFPFVKSGIHALTGTGTTEKTKENKDIKKLTAQVNNLSKRPVVISQPRGPPPPRLRQLHPQAAPAKKKKKKKSPQVNPRPRKGLEFYAT